MKWLFVFTLYAFVVTFIGTNKLMEENVLANKIAGFSLISNLVAALLFVLVYKFELLSDALFTAGGICLGLAMITAAIARIMDASFISELAMLIVWLEVIVLIGLFVLASFMAGVC